MILFLNLSTVYSLQNEIILKTVERLNNFRCKNYIKGFGGEAYAKIIVHMKNTDKDINCILFPGGIYSGRFVYYEADESPVMSAEWINSLF